jgi:hypothetical protein
MALLDRFNVPRRGKAPTDAQVARAVQLYRDGESTAAIGSLLGFSGETIRQRLLNTGVTIRGSHKWRHDRASRR